MAILNRFPPLLALGPVVATPAATCLLKHYRLQPVALLNLHQHGDWGNVTKAAAKANDKAAAEGGQVKSSYKLGDDELWIITECFQDDIGLSRSKTTMLHRGEGYGS